MARILLVEDNGTFRQSLKETLLYRFPSLIIEEAENGQEALEKVKASPPDLIFMDIRLPGENGLILTKRIKTQYPNIIIVILTSYDLPEYREAAFQYQANHFITKAAPTQEIIGVVESVLSASDREKGKG